MDDVSVFPRSLHQRWPQRATKDPPPIAAVYR